LTVPDAVAARDVILGRGDASGHVATVEAWTVGRWLRYWLTTRTSIRQAKNATGLWDTRGARLAAGAADDHVDPGHRRANVRQYRAKIPRPRRTRYSTLKTWKVLTTCAAARPRHSPYPGDRRPSTRRGRLPPTMKMAQSSQNWVGRSDDMFNSSVEVRR